MEPAVVLPLSATQPAASDEGQTTDEHSGIQNYGVPAGRQQAGR